MLIVAMLITFIWPQLARVSSPSSAVVAFEEQLAVAYCFQRFTNDGKLMVRCTIVSENAPDESLAKTDV